MTVVTVLAYITLMLIVVILYGIERRLWGQALTPFALLAFPFLAVTACALVLADPLQFRPLDPETIGIWIVGLLIFWLGGLLAYLLIKRLHLPMTVENRPVNFDTLNRRVLLVASWLIIAVMFYAFLKFSIGLVGRSTAILSEDFQEAYGAGFFGYARAIGMFLVIVLIGQVRRKDFLSYLTIIVILALLFTTLVKGTIMLPLVGGLLYRLYSGKATLSWKGAGKVSALLGSLFFAPYTVAVLLVNPTFDFFLDTMSDVTRSFFLYLFSGILSLGDALRVNLDVTNHDHLVIFAPLLNLYNNLTAAGLESVRPITHYESMIDLSGIATHTSNVHTIFGTLYLFLGPLPFVLYAFLLGIFCYLFLYVQSRGNHLLRGLIAFFLGALVFGWFEFYYWHTMFYIPIAFAVLLYGVEYLLRLPLRRRNHCWNPVMPIERRL